MYVHVCPCSVLVCVCVSLHLSVSVSECVRVYIYGVHMCTIHTHSVSEQIVGLSGLLPLLRITPGKSVVLSAPHPSIGVSPSNNK